MILIKFLGCEGKKFLLSSKEKLIQVKQKRDEEFRFWNPLIQLEDSRLRDGKRESLKLIPDTGWSSGKTSVTPAHVSFVSFTHAHQLCNPYFALLCILVSEFCFPLTLAAGENFLHLKVGERERKAQILAEKFSVGSSFFSPPPSS